MAGISQKIRSKRGDRHHESFRAMGLALVKHRKVSRLRGLPATGEQIYPWNLVNLLSYPPSDRQKPEAEAHTVEEAERETA